MKQIIVLLLYITTTYLHTSDTTSLYSSMHYNDYFHGNLNNSDINADSWDISTGLNIINDSSSINVSTQSYLNNFSSTNIDTSSIILDLNSDLIEGVDDIHSINMDFTYKDLALGLSLGDLITMYGDWNFNILPGILVGINATYESHDYPEFEIFDTYTISLDNISREFGVYFSQQIEQFTWNIDAKLLSISNMMYDNKIQARYDLSYIPYFSGELSYNRKLLLLSLGIQYSYLDPFEISLYHDDKWFGSMSIDKKSYLFKINSSLSSERFQLGIEYDNYTLGESSALAESKVFIYGPLAYKKILFDLPEMTLQRLGGFLSWTLFGFNIKTTYNRYLMDTGDINWNYYDFLWSGLMPKVSYASPLESYSISYDHLNTLDFNIGYERSFLERFHIRINASQLIPYFDFNPAIKDLEDMANFGRDRSSGFDADGGRSYTLEISMNI